MNLMNVNRLWYLKSYILNNRSFPKLKKKHQMNGGWSQLATSAMEMARRAKFLLAATSKAPLALTTQETLDRFSRELAFCNVFWVPGAGHKTEWSQWKSFACWQWAVDEAMNQVFWRLGTAHLSWAEAAERRGLGLERTHSISWVFLCSSFTSWGITWDDAVINDVLPLQCLRELWGEWLVLLLAHRNAKTPFWPGRLLHKEESQNRGTVWVGRDLKWSSSPNRLLWAGTSFTTPRCSKSHPTWPWALPVMGYPQLWVETVAVSMFGHETYAYVERPCN